MTEVVAEVLRIEKTDVYLNEIFKERLVIYRFYARQCREAEQMYGAQMNSTVGTTNVNALSANSRGGSSGAPDEGAQRAKASHLRSL